jgi:ATP synthase protein I
LLDLIPTPKLWSAPFRARPETAFFPALGDFFVSDRDQDRDGGSHGNEAELSSRLRTLEEKLDVRRAEERAAEAVRRRQVAPAVAQAIRLGGEFIAGVLVGAGLGWLIDWWLGTSPWGLVVFLLLGFVAGVLNVLRAAGLASPPESRIRRRDEDGK